MKGATGPAPGAKFKGHNANGSKSWSTLSTVVDAKPDHRFSFLVTVGPFKIAEWAFDVAGTDDGCRVTETWTDRRGWLMKTLGAKASGVDDRVEHIESGWSRRWQASPPVRSRSRRPDVVGAVAGLLELTRGSYRAVGSQPASS